RQRLALARAVLRNPRLLILDDATSAIDPVVEQRILDRLRTELDTTALIIAHRVATIRLADRVVYLDDGRVRAAGTHDEPLAGDPGYAALVRAYEADVALRRSTPNWRNRPGRVARRRRCRVPS